MKQGDIKIGGQYAAIQNHATALKFPNFKRYRVMVLSDDRTVYSRDGYTLKKGFTVNMYEPYRDEKGNPIFVQQATLPAMSFDREWSAWETERKSSIDRLQEVYLRDKQRKIENDEKEEYLKDLIADNFSEEERAGVRAAWDPKQDHIQVDTTTFVNLVLSRNDYQETVTSLLATIEIMQIELDRLKQV